MGSQNVDFLKGALIGTVVGGIAALLIAPKAGKELRAKLADDYRALQQNGNDFIETLKEKGHRLTHPFEREESHSNALLIGGAIGAVIAALAAILLAPQSGDKLRSNLGETYDFIRKKAANFISEIESKGGPTIEDLGGWSDVFATIIDKFSANREKKTTHSRADELLNLAHLGVRLYQQLQNRR